MNVDRPPSMGGPKLKTNSMKIKFVFSFFIWTSITDPGPRFLRAVRPLLAPAGSPLDALSRRSLI